MNCDSRECLALSTSYLQRLAVCMQQLRDRVTTQAIELSGDSTAIVILLDAGLSWKLAFHFFGDTRSKSCSCPRSRAIDHWPSLALFHLLQHILNLAMLEVESRIQEGSQVVSIVIWRVTLQIQTYRATGRRVSAYLRWTKRRGRQA